MSKPTKLEKKAIDKLEEVLSKLGILPEDLNFVVYSVHSDLGEVKPRRIKNEQWKLEHKRFRKETNQGENMVFFVSDIQVGTRGGKGRHHIKLQKSQTWELECIRKDNVEIWPMEQDP